MKDNLTTLSAAQAAELIRAGRLTSVALVEACLARIDETDSVIKAWVHLDPENALEQAREADRIRRAGHGTGVLHGVPVGLKDIIDTRALPTECGTPAMAGRQPTEDSAVVERLIEAGAVILGKTATAECAFLNPAETTNPFDPSRTPGGSSSGSAAAVAARQVPLAIGSQTNGSVIRPASFCGTYGFKPSSGLISRRGFLQTSETLDQVGVFARDIADTALFSQALAGYDPRDAASLARPAPGFVAGAAAEPPVEPELAWFDLPINSRLEADAREGIDAVLETLGPRVQRFEAAPQLNDLVHTQAVIHHYEVARNLDALYVEHGPMLSDKLHEALAKGREISTGEYEDALGVRQSAVGFFVEVFNDVDAIITPAATGEAPKISGGTTGDPIFCSIWTLAGLPCLSLPLLVGENNLPIGVQLVGAMEEDDRLLRTAGWMVEKLSAAD